MCVKRTAIQTEGRFHDDQLTRTGAHGSTGSSSVTVDLRRGPHSRTDLGFLPRGRRGSRVVRPRSAPWWFTALEPALHGNDLDTYATTTAEARPESSGPCAAPVHVGIRNGRAARGQFSLRPLRNGEEVAWRKLVGSSGRDSRPRSGSRLRQPRRLPEGRSVFDRSGAGVLGRSLAVLLRT